MWKTLSRIVFGSAIYGFTIGSVHSYLFAFRNLVKFPLLILVTTVICSIAYYLVARSVSVKMNFRDTQRLVLELFGNTSVLLASLAPVLFFLANTIEHPDHAGLCEYPLFMGLNLLFVAVCGSFSLVHLGKSLLARCGIGTEISAFVIVCWLALSFLVGSQAAWFLRPFCGVSSLEEETPFILGTEPDFRGDTSFYQALYHLFDPKPLAEGYYREKVTRGCLGGPEVCLAL